MPKVRKPNKILRFPRKQVSRFPRERGRVMSLQEIVGRKYAPRKKIIGGLLRGGETVLFAAREKEGKSHFALQLTIAVSRGETFLGRSTTETRVLYVDYENPPDEIKRRALKLTKNHNFRNIFFVSFDAVASRDLGFSQEEDFARLVEEVHSIRPGLLIIDPLHYAWGRESTDRIEALKMMDMVSKLHMENPDMAIILVHHIKKKQGEGRPARLLDDPRAWMSKIFGSQALLAAAQTLWGLEASPEGTYTFATVPRSHKMVVRILQKDANNQRLRLARKDTVLFHTVTQREAWERLPKTFSIRKGKELGITQSVIEQIINQGMNHGWVELDSTTKKYKKLR